MNVKIASIIAFVLVIAFSFVLFNKQKESKPLDSKYGIYLEVPPDYEILATLKDTTALQQSVAGLFLDRLEKGPGKIAIRVETSGKTLIFLADRTQNILRKKTTLPTGAIIQFTWRGNIEQRLKYARENNTFDIPGLTKAELKNLYH